MANVANTTSVVAGGLNPIRAINNLMTSISESFRRSRQFQATYRELDALGARELADLGISRSDITRIAYEAVYGDGTSEFNR